MRLRTLFALTASTVLIAGCGSDGSDGSRGFDGSPATADELDGNTYASAEVTGHEMVIDTQITLAFEDGNLAVSAGCNTQTAGYEVTDGTVKWSGPAASTMKACSDELMAQDQWLAGLFTEGVEAELDGTALGITASDGTEMLLETD